MKVFLYTIMFLEVAVISGCAFLLITAVRHDKMFSDTLHYFYPALVESGPALFTSTMLGRSVNLGITGEVESVDTAKASLRLKIIPRTEGIPRLFLPSGESHDFFDHYVSIGKDALFRNVVFGLEGGTITEYRDGPLMPVAAAASELQPGDLVIVHGSREKEGSIFGYGADFITKVVFKPVKP